MHCCDCKYVVIWFKAILGSIHLALDLPLGPHPNAGAARAQRPRLGRLDDLGDPRSDASWQQANWSGGSHVRASNCFTLFPHASQKCNVRINKGCPCKCQCLYVRAEASEPMANTCCTCKLKAASMPLRGHGLIKRAQEGALQSISHLQNHCALNSAVVCQGSNGR